MVFLSVVIPCFEFHSAALHSSFVVITEFLPSIVIRQSMEVRPFALVFLSVDIKRVLNVTSNHDFSFNTTIAKYSSAYPP